MINNYVLVDTTTNPVQYHKIQFELVPENAPEIELYSKSINALQYVDIFSEEMEITSTYIIRYATRL